MDEEISLPIRVDMEAMRQGMSQLDALARAGGETAAKSLSSGVGKGLAGLKAQMGPARETAMFFTQALGEFGPAGRTAQVALSGLAGAIMGGGGVLVALSLAQVGAQLLAESWGESGRAAVESARAAKEAASQIAAEIKLINDATAAQLLKLAGGTGAMEMMRSELEPARRLLEKEKRALASAQEDLAIVTSGKNVVDGIIQINMTALEAKQAVQQYSTSVDALAAKVAALEAKARGLLAGEEAGEAGTAARAAADRARQALLEQERRNQAALLAGETAWLGERARLRVEHERILAGLSTPEAKRAEQERYWAADLAVAQRASAAKFQLAEQSRAETAALTAAGNASDLAQAEAHASRLKAIEEDTARKLQQMREDSIRGLASGFVNMFGPVLTTSRAYNNAMKAAGGTAQNTADLSIAAFAAMTQGVLANLAQQAGVESLMELARAYAAYARYDPASGAGHMLAAGTFGSVAGLAAAGAIAIGQTRGMTASEKASVEDQRQQGTGGASVGGAREFGGGAGTGGTVTVRETIYIGIVANDFESPAETARRAARVMELVDRLDLQRREA